MARRTKQQRTAETCPVTNALLEDALAPVIAWTTAERGRKADFVIEFQSLVFPESVTRNQIESWIHPEPEKRVEPSFRYGLALMAIAEKIGIYKKTAKPTPEPKKQ